VIAGLYCVIDGTVLLLTGQLVRFPDLRGRLRALREEAA